ncbi:MAG: leucine/isoleucine/valine transporter permease subunit [Anaerolineae bacterium]
MGLAVTRGRGQAVRIGLIGGVVVIIIALQGMIQGFAKRNIVGDVSGSGLSTGIALLLITAFVAAFFAVNRSGRRELLPVLLDGVIAGFLTALFLDLLIWVGGVISLGDIFINATNQLYELLTFGQGIVIGSVIWLALGSAMGAIAAGIHLLPSNARRAILYGLAATSLLGILQDLVLTTMKDWVVIGSLVRFLYVSNGLSYLGAVILLAVIAGLSYAWMERGNRVTGRIQSLSPNAQRGLTWGALGAGVLLLILLPQILGLYLSEVLDNIGLYLLMGLGLNIVVGFAGLLDLGYVAFFAIGAYTVGVLCSPELSTQIFTNWWVALPFAVLAAAFMGIMLGIPVLRLRGDYLAIVTLGFGEIVRLLALSDMLKTWLGGAQGIQGIPNASIGPIIVNTSPQYYYLFLGGCLLVIFVATRLKKSRIGRAWMAVREDEDVAQSMGINLVTTKLLAFAMGASFAGLSGAIFGSKLQSVYPASFNFIVSINVLSVVIIGGMGSIPGVILGALALVGLPELLREFAEYRYLVYGAVLVVMMLTRPEGLLPDARRREEIEEFKEEESEGEAVLASLPGG